MGCSGGELPPADAHVFDKLDVPVQVENIYSAGCMSHVASFCRKVVSHDGYSG